MLTCRGQVKLYFNSLYFRLYSGFFGGGSCIFIHSSIYLYMSSEGCSEMSENQLVCWVFRVFDEVSNFPRSVFGSVPNYTTSHTRIRQYFNFLFFQSFYLMYLLESLSFRRKELWTFYLKRRWLLVILTDLRPPCTGLCKRLIFNPLNTKRTLLYLKTQFVPRSKHFSSRL